MQIEDLQSDDGHAFEEEEEGAAPGAGRVVPEELLQTDTRVGLTSEEVLQRRRKFGLNQMKEEKENMILKFLGFFVGPIQFVMEVSSSCSRPNVSETKRFGTSLSWPFMLTVFHRLPLSVCLYPPKKA